MYYDDNVLPTLNKIAKNGIVIPGTASMGAPTINGFLGVLSSEKPKLHGLIIYSSRENEMESHTRLLAERLGYYTTLTLPAPATFDLKGPWIFDHNRFNEIHYYYPDEYHR